MAITPSVVVVVVVVVVIVIIIIVVVVGTETVQSVERQGYGLHNLRFE